MGLPIKNDGFSRHMGFEPGLHAPSRGVDSYKALSWMSELPNIDIRHDSNFTKSRWGKEQFNHPENIKGWTESDSGHIPGWKNLDSILGIHE